MLFKQAKQIEELTRLPEVWNTALKALAEQSISFVNYVTVDQAGSNAHVLTNVPDLYAAADPATDPFLDWCCRTYDTTLTGPDYLGDYDYLPEEAKGFIRSARETGFRTGIGIPMRLQGSQRYGGFNLGTGYDRPTFEAKILPRAEEFRFFCLLVHRRIEELSDSEVNGTKADFRKLLVAPEKATLGRLTPREKEVLYLIAQGISRKECARLCGISPHTVAEHAKSAYRKLGIQNRVEAARLVFAAAE